MKDLNNFIDLNFKLKDISVETFIVTGQFDDLEIIKNLKNKIKEKVKESSLNYKTNVKGLFSGFDSFKQDDDFCKFILSIKKAIKCISNYNFSITDCWGNILKKNDEVIEHNHAKTDFCGILYLTENGPGTYFPQYDFTINEKIGRFILFSPILKHSVKKIEEDMERYTLAFNADRINDWDNFKNIKKYEI